MRSKIFQQWPSLLFLTSLRLHCSITNQREIWLPFLLFGLFFFIMSHHLPQQTSVSDYLNWFACCCVRWKTRHDGCLFIAYFTTFGGPSYVTILSAVEIPYLSKTPLPVLSPEGIVFSLFPLAFLTTTDFKWTRSRKLIYYNIIYLSMYLCSTLCG